MDIELRPPLVAVAPADLQGNNNTGTGLAGSGGEGGVGDSHQVPWFQRAWEDLPHIPTMTGVDRKVFEEQVGRGRGWW